MISLQQSESSPTGTMEQIEADLLLKVGSVINTLSSAPDKFYCPCNGKHRWIDVNPHCSQSVKGTTVLLRREPGVDLSICHPLPGQERLVVDTIWLNWENGDLAIKSVTRRAYTIPRKTNIQPEQNDLTEGERFETLIMFSEYFVARTQH